LKPTLIIDLTGPDGNAYQMIAKARRALGGHGQRADEILTRFMQITGTPGKTYWDVRQLIEEYCDVTWKNGETKS
jgi:hypothetical protein